MTEPSTGAGGTAVEITIPGTPDACLSLNGRAHWRVKAKRVREFRATAKYAAREQYQGPAMRGAVDIHYEIGWEKGRKHVDTDNAIGMLKPLCDGLIDAHVIGDDRYVVNFSVVQRKDPDGRGFVRVTVKEAAA